VHDQSLRCDACLACVGEASNGGRSCGAVDVGIGKHDEGIGAAELEDALFEVASGEFADGAAGTLGTGQRHSLQDRAGNHGGDLVVGCEHVLVRARRETGSVKKFGDP
jgi:hypothetical protein